MATIHHLPIPWTKAPPAILGHIDESLLNVLFIRKGIALYQSLVDFWNVDVCSGKTAMKYITTAHVCHGQLQVKERLEKWGAWVGFSR